MAAETSADVLQLVCTLHASFDGINTITALHRTVTLLKPAQKSAVLAHTGYQVLLRLATAHAPALAARGTANGLYALARLPAPPHPQLLDAMIASMQRTLLRMDSQGLANSVWALARMDHTPASELLKEHASRPAVLFIDIQNQVSAA